MEKFQMLLPFSSAGQSTFDPVTSGIHHHAVNNFQAHHRHQEDSAANGFLGLSTEKLLAPTGSEAAITRDLSNDNNNSVSMNFACGSEGEVKPPGKKKGEKKVRRPRYAFQTRSQVDILDDGYRWRKYGQKAVKNNKFPRSYYRCTHQGCNVKKQVQRLTKDEGVVVTTYEGMHTHPIEKPTDNFEHILSQMQIYTTPF